MSQTARRCRAPSASRYPAGFGTIWTTVALDLIGFGIVLPILPLYAERFGASADHHRLPPVVVLGGPAAARPLWGRLSDRIGRKPVILISLFGTAVGSLLTGAAGSLPILFLGRIVDGASGASVSVAQAAVADVAGRPSGRACSACSARRSASASSPGPAIGALAALGRPARPVLPRRCHRLVNALVAIRRLPETRPSAPSRRRTGANPPKSSAAMSGPTCGASLCRAFVATAAFSGFEATFALFGQARFDLTLSSTGAVFAGIGLFLVLVQAGLVHPVVSRLGAVGTLRAGSCSTSSGSCCWQSRSTGRCSCLPSPRSIIGQGLMTPTLASIVAGRSPSERRGGALGLQQTAGGLAVSSAR